MLLSNPASSPLFLPTLALAGGLLGAGFVALCIAERSHLREMPHRTLFRRWVSWLVITVVYGGAVLGGLVPTTLLVLFLALQGVREYLALNAPPPVYRFTLLALSAATCLAAAVSTELFLALPAPLLLVATLQPLLTQDVRAGMRNLAFVTLGWGYLPLLLSHFLLIQRDLPGGAGLLVLLALSVALSDVGAYCFGTFFGKHKLAPTISPHKTWEGVAGNAVGAAVGVVLTRYALPPELPEAARWLLPAVIALAAVWGDLVESALKREFAVKDTGVWLPGFGGLLDRIDSLIFLVPIGYHYFRFAMGPGHGS